MKPNLTIVACANGEPTIPYLKRGFDAFMASSRRYGYEPILLGWAEHWGGLGSKPRRLKKAIEDGVIQTEYMIFADAFDVAFAGTPDDILRYFLEWNKHKDVGIIWNAEKSCFPDASLAEKHPEVSTEFRYLNSGLAVGRTDAFLAALTEMKAQDIPNDSQRPDGSWDNPNDQGLFMTQFISGSVPMMVDSDCFLFQTLCGVEAHELAFTEKGIQNSATGSYPIGFHWNGPSKDFGLMEPMLKHMNL